MISDYYIYVLMDSSKPGKFIYGEYTFDYEPFYIGKGRGDRIKNTLYDKAPFKKNKIDKLNKLGIEIISEKVIDNISNDKSKEIEIELIKLIGRRDLNNGILVNCTDGGDGRENSKHSEKTKLKISKNRKGKGIGWKHSDKTLKIMSEKQTGENNGFHEMTHSIETKEAHSKLISGLNHPMYGKTHSDETRRSLKEGRKKISNEKIKKACQKFNKPVLMYDLELNFIKEFESVKTTSEETKINESIISKCCRGDIKNPTRYFFRYKHEEDNVKNNKFLINKGDQFTIDYKKYKLIKRNKTSAICELESEKITLRYNDFKFLEFKDTNNIHIIKLYLFLKNIDKTLKIKDDLIYNDRLKIRYIKLINNSKLFIDEMENDSDVVIFEDEWINKNTIVKSRLNNLLNKSERIFARKCDVREITDNNLIRKFLNENHIQGFVGSIIKIGLYYNDELVSIMTFGALRKSMGKIAEDNVWELLRFCNKINTTVIGGASKLFKFFLRNYNPKKIISYCDKRWSKDGNLYKQLGFNLIHHTVPNYYWIIDNKREYRYRWRKDILVKMGYDPNMTEIQIMNSLNRYRIFDRGSIKFEYINHSF